MEMKTTKENYITNDYAKWMISETSLHSLIFRCIIKVLNNATAMQMMAIGFCY